MRLIVQSLATGRFLAPSMDDGQPEWVRSLALSGGGVVGDVERALQLLCDWTDADDEAVVVDLDVLGTVGDTGEPESHFVSGNGEAH